MLDTARNISSIDFTYLQRQNVYKKTWLEDQIRLNLEI